MSEPPRPPAQLAPYVEVLGVSDAIRFLLEFGGAELYIAPSPKGQSRLVQLIGLERAEALGRRADRLPRRVPLGKPWIAAVWAAQGLPCAEIARRLHVSDVTVRRWLGGAMRPNPSYDPRQLDLF